MAKRIGLATCRTLPEPDPDQELLLDALRSKELAPELIAWDDPSAQPAAFDLCVLRSTWNYYHDVDSFVNWLDRANDCTRLFNPHSVLRWNLHKRYLTELTAAGINVVPTAWVSRGEPASLAGILDENGWDDVVVKPAISAGSHRTQRFKRKESADGQGFLNSLAATGDAMVQRYMPAVADSGERSLVWIDGAFTHAVTKSPRFADGSENVSEASALSESESRFGERVIAHVSTNVPRGNELLYARVDVIPDDTGAPCLSELELLEPSLFLAQHPPALARFSEAIAKRTNA